MDLLHFDFRASAEKTPVRSQSEEEVATPHFACRESSQGSPRVQLLQHGVMASPHSPIHLRLTSLLLYECQPMTCMTAIKVNGRVGQVAIVYYSTWGGWLGVLVVEMVVGEWWWGKPARQPVDR